MHIFEDKDPSENAESTEASADSAEVTEDKAFRSDLIRLSVNLNLETAAALREFADRRGLSFTESIRRVISIAHYLENEISEGRKIQIVDEDRRKVWELDF